MSREAFGDPPESQEAPDLCPVCGNDWHAEDCVFGKEVALRLKAERDAHRMQFALHRLWPALERAMAGLVFTADRAGEVQADMNTLREYSKTQEFECQGEPSLCDNPRGCACAPDPTLKPDIAALKKRLAEDPGFAAEVTGDKPPAPGCHTPEGCRENGCLGWCDEHRPEASAGVEDLQREVARLKVENARLAEETMRLQRLLNAAHQIVGELARPSGI